MKSCWATVWKCNINVRQWLQTQTVSWNKYKQPACVCVCVCRDQPAVCTLMYKHYESCRKLWNRRETLKCASLPPPADPVLRCLPGESDPTETVSFNFLPPLESHIQAVQLHNMQIKRSDWTGQGYEAAGGGLSAANAFEPDQSHGNWEMSAMINQYNITVRTGRVFPATCWLHFTFLVSKKYSHSTKCVCVRQSIKNNIYPTLFFLRNNMGMYEIIQVSVLKWFGYTYCSQRSAVTFHTQLGISQTLWGCCCALTVFLHWSVRWQQQSSPESYS